MRAEYINPFVASASNVFSTMLGCKLERGSLTIKEGRRPEHEVSGVISMSGQAAGTVVVSLSKSAAIGCAATLLAEDPSSYDEVNGDVADAIGEIANMIAGGAKAKLEELSLSIGSPS